MQTTKFSDSNPVSSAVLRPLRAAKSEGLIRNWADRFGICLSALCVVHCLLTPIVLILIPSLGAASYHELLHSSLLVVLPFLALAAFVPGYFRHRNASVFVWGASGLTLIAIGSLIFHDHGLAQVTASVLGSGLLIKAHLLNRSLCACCVSGHRRTGRPGRRLGVGGFRADPRKPKRERLLTSPLKR